MDTVVLSTKRGLPLMGFEPGFIKTRAQCANRYTINASEERHDDKKAKKNLLSKRHIENTVK